MPSATPTDLALRPAALEDAADVARVHLLSRKTAVASGAMPPGIHGDSDVEAWLAARLQVDEVWVAEVDAVVVAYLRLTEEWLDDLYVVPDRSGQGIGSALLELAKALRPAGFGLWVFETNLGARRFYASAGLVEGELTDGSDNEERAPDVRMLWIP
ncbi:GNAT family N-acetyltransferase [Nocardioides sp.]|uniref:GNAT family N-acetyltransferase n=1 Tax=Nocardioides sp. TaxID=35761 RepID=UPI002B2748C9|nr:GNAT family N-acetyltransferase [Nocardioides sp.]